MEEVILWSPGDDFNMADYRDLGSKEIPPPYALSFVFQEEAVVGGVRLDAVGWNFPGCGTDSVFSKMSVVKNDKDVLYDGKFSGEVRFKKGIRIYPEKDKVRVTIQPTCPAHTATIRKVAFLAPTSTPPLRPSTPSLPPLPSETETKDLVQQALPLPELNDYWYIYTTIFVMFLILLITGLFALMRKK